VAVELATAYVALTVETRNVAKEVQAGFDPAQKIADRSGAKAGKAFTKGLKPSFAGIAGLFSGAMAGLAVKDFLGDALSEARESQKVGALTAQVIKTTGGAAKITATQVGSLAEALSKKTGIDDEAIQTGSNLLLTFKNIRNEAGLGNDMFNQATAAALDLSKAGFGSVDGAAKMLGKALNDPVKGIAALGRAGVTFTAEQKKQIKVMAESGNVLGAQKLIMKELQSQVGGAAEATATAGEKARVTFDNIKEAAGTRLLPIVDSLATKFNEVVAEFQAGTGTGGQIKAVFEGIGTAVGWLGDHMTLVKGTLAALIAGYLVWKGVALSMNVINAVQLTLLKAQTVGTVQQAIVSKAAAAGAKLFAAGQWLVNAALSANPIGIVVLAIVALIGIVVLAYKKNETFRKIVQAVWAGIKSAIKGTVDWFKNTAWPWMRDVFTWIGDKATWLWKNVLSIQFKLIRDGIGLVVKGFQAAKTGIATAWNALEGITKKPIKFVIQTVLNDGLIGGFNWLSSKIGGPTVARIPLPKGFAQGGVLPGYTPGRDVHSFYSPTGGRLDLSGGEAIMRPEFTRLVGGKKGVDRLNSLARHGYAGGGVLDWIKKKGVDSFNWMKDKASAVMRAVKDPIGFLKSKLPRIPGSDLMAEAAVGVKNKLVGIAGQKLSGLWRAFKPAFTKASGTGVGSNARGWQQLWSIVHGLLPGIQLTSSFRPGSITASGNRSYHALGRAIDVAPPSMAAFERIRNAFPNATELIYSPAGARQLKNGRSYIYGEPVRSMHYDHIHLAMRNGGVVPAPVFDNGGTLRPGLNVVDNRTGADEHLVRADQAGGVVVYMNVSIDDLAKMSKLEDFLRMLDGARVSSRKTLRSGKVSA
jgi:hypothetical protein